MSQDRKKADGDTKNHKGQTCSYHFKSKMAGESSRCSSVRGGFSDPSCLNSNRYKRPVRLGVASSSPAYRESVRGTVRQQGLEWLQPPVHSPHLQLQLHKVKSLIWPYINKTELNACAWKLHIYLIIISNNNKLTQ